MAEQSLLDTDAPANIRSPLIPHTNTKSATIAAKSPRKVSRRASFGRRLDSSESIPSSHGSIFAAEYVSPHASEDGGYKIEKWQAIDSSARPPIIEEQPQSLLGNDENSDVGLSVGNTPILYGHGTALTTIVEQKSTATMRPISTPSPVRTLTRPRSTSDLSSLSASASLPKQPPKSSPIRGEFSISGMIHRLASFSDDDVGTIKLSWPEGYNPIANTAKGAANSSLNSSPSEIQESAYREIYAQPLSPIQPPIERPETPPGMPSWTTAQTQQRRPRAVSSPPTRPNGFHRATARVQRFFGYEPVSRAGNRAPVSSPGHGLCGAWDIGSSRRRCVSVPNTALSGAPRFRPPRSGHGITSLEMHPFARADVRPNTSRTQEMASTGRRISSAPAAGGGSRSSRRSSEPLPPRPVKPKGKRKPGRRVRFTSSTAAVIGSSQTQSAEPNSERRRTKFLRSCRRRRVKTPSPPPQEAAPFPAWGETSMPDTLPQDLPAGSLENHPDHLPALPVLPASSPPETAAPAEPSPAPSPSPKPKKWECWKHQVKTTLAQVNEIWDSCTLLCCWYCCGIDVMSVADDAAAERLSNGVSH
ncbi:hypothetical protein V494_05002 [Pseudogymnoascus sp. VKM F-4513 (FW-928)]|nr:hypothetical protein V494_05002 [Pseudogymnoascus sp. VKM F-4513 (FW-928)]